MSRNRLSRLLDMLSYCRPAGSETERVFRERFILTSCPGAYTDTFGNIHVTIGDPLVLFSCHTDTVHRNHGRQTIHHDPKTGIVSLSRRLARRSNCLGADDTAGCFLMLELIAAGIPGRYIFHHAEEKGGIGSSDLACKHHDWLAETPIAIAFDRRGTSDVITHQSYGRCCSDAFARSLADQLTLHGLKYTPCDRGIFTDTANYVGAIAECTNLSVGYAAEHSPRETLDTRHLFALADALIALDYSALTIERTPGEDDPWPDDWVDHFNLTKRPNDGSIVLDWQTGERLDHSYSFSSTDDEDDWCEYCGYGCVCDRELRRSRSLFLDPDMADILKTLRKD